MNKRQMTYMIRMTLFLVLFMCMIILMSGCQTYQEREIESNKEFYEKYFYYKNVDTPIREDEL